MAPEHATGRIKGAAFRELLLWLARHRAPLLERALPELDAAALAELDLPRGILASTWYPADSVHQLLNHVTNPLTPEERLELAFRASDAVMQATLRGVYRVLFKLMANPERYARYSGKLWSAYYDSGHFLVEMPSDTIARCSIRGWRAHHPFMCELNWGAAGAIYRAMGCKQVRVRRLQCVDEGGDGCVFVTSWQR